MFDCILYSVCPEQAPTELESWAALEAKSQTTAADLVSQTLANIDHAAANRRQAIRRRRLVLALSAATALAVYYLR